MEIKKIIYKKSILTIVYEDGGSVFSLKTEDEPGAKMLECLAKLKRTLMRALGFSTTFDAEKDYDGVPYKDAKVAAATLERNAVSLLFSAIGIAYKWNDKTGSSYVIYGSLKDNVLKTKPMNTTPEAAFWDGKNPRDYPELLTPEEKEAIDILIAETEAFVAGSRDQLELFEDTAPIPDDEDNGGEEE